MKKMINLWTGWGVEPKKGSVKEFLDLLGFLFKDSPELLEWFKKWLAFPIQNPGEKNLTAVLLHSKAQGVGKSFVGYIMKDIYGENFVVIDQEALKGPFNAWAAKKQFVLGEEITGSNSRGLSDRIKNMITRESIHVNEKYQPNYDLEDKANFLFTSNHVDAMFIEETDRRLAVIEIKGDAMPQAWYDKIDRWRANGGAAHLFEYLLNEIDLSDYNPKAHAPKSAAKDAMIALSKSDLDLAVEQIRDNPDDILCSANLVNDCPLLTTTQLQSFINTYTEGHSALIAISKALRRGGFRQEKVKTVDGTKKLWAVRDLDKMRRLDASNWPAIYNEHQRRNKFK